MRATVFFKVLRGTEELYTRAGAFKLDQNGVIVDSNGYILQPQITVPEGTVSLVVDSTGQVTSMDSASTATILGQLLLYKFPNNGGLKAEGKNLFRNTPASGDPIEGTAGADGYGTVAQGFLEQSNVQVVDEMVGMIVAQRAYEANAKAIQTLRPDAAAGQ